MMMMMHLLSLVQLATCLQFVLLLGAYRLAAAAKAGSWPAEKPEPASAEAAAAAGVSSLADSHRRLHQSSEISNGSAARQVRSVCLWDCSSAARQKQQQQQLYQKQKQNTTRLLLFTEASGGQGTSGGELGSAGELAELAATSLTKFSPPNELRESKFQAQHHTILMIHGFRGSGISRQPWALETKELALAAGRPRANVLFADWSHHARVLSYLHAIEHINEVAEDLFSMLENFQSAFPGFRMERMEIIGHSLGAHIAGLLGQMMRGRLHKITALGFLLGSVRPHLKLSRDDAAYVIAYHTDTRYFGTNMNLADRDVYFGDGTNQPACGRDQHFAAHFLPSTCNHRLSTKYSSTYMGHCLMVGYLCASYAEFASGACGFCDRDSADCVLVGHRWQYSADAYRPSLAGDGAHAIHKPQPSGPHGVEWNEDQSSRYFIEVQADKPYCAFTYQVVAVFPESAQLDQLRQLELVLLASNATEQESLLRLRLTNQRHLNRAQVFKDSRGRAGSVQAEHVFTGLALVQPASSEARPPRFTEALLAEHLFGPAPAAGSAQAQARRQLEEASKVFVNYMSHIGFQERAAKSGPVQVKWISGQRVARD